MQPRDEGLTLLEQRDEGLTLLELLVVLIIVGILTAIAIPAFFNQRERAWRTDLQSDLRNAAVEAENYFTEDDTYQGFAIPDTFQHSDGVQDITVARADANGFCLWTSHVKLEENWMYDSVRDPQLSEGNCS